MSICYNSCIEKCYIKCSDLKTQELHFKLIIKTHLLQIKNILGGF